MKISDFKEFVLDWYTQNGRHDLPWRGEFEPYHVFLSEIMLQQTQVPRVLEKFKLFLSNYHDIHSLAAASQSEVLRDWKGLGYNRRALFLHRSAIEIVERYQGILPDDEASLLQLPGIGTATARAMLAYAYNKPVIYIETNIRATFIHHFFADQDNVSDSQLEPIARECLGGVEPRHWYSGLMDYGTWLKKAHGNPNRRSKHYSVQSKFEGSDRQLRGKILDLLLEEPANYEELNAALPGEEHRLQRIINDLQKEGFVHEEQAKYRLK